jgi:hypothetical protein
VDVILESLYLHRSLKTSEHWSLMPLILATHEAETRRFLVQSKASPGQIVWETLSQKTHHKK